MAKQRGSGNREGKARERDKMRETVKRKRQEHRWKGKTIMRNKMTEKINIKSSNRGGMKREEKEIEEGSRRNRRRRRTRRKKRRRDGLGWGGGEREGKEGVQNTVHTQDMCCTPPWRRLPFVASPSLPKTRYPLFLRYLFSSFFHLEEF